jgi:hypothetical protein
MFVVISAYSDASGDRHDAQTALLERTGLHPPLRKSRSVIDGGLEPGDWVAVEQQPAAEECPGELSQSFSILWGLHFALATRYVGASLSKRTVI